jgi:peptidoglycan/xylan/chitin deacetylase (PgdA/CDA1 family)
MIIDQAMEEIDMSRVLSPNYRFILFLGFDVDIDSAEVWRNADYIERSYGRYGAVKGVRKVINILEIFGVKATFFVPGWVAENYPEIVNLIMTSGYEVGAHGYLHEKLDQVENEYDLLCKMDKILKPYYSKIKGFRSPYWRFSEESLRYLVKLGYNYDSSLMDNDVPYIMDIDGSKLLELPVDWRLDDWPHLKTGLISLKDLYNRWIYEFKTATRETLYISLTFHPQLISRGSNIELLKRIIHKALSMNAQILSGRELCETIFSAYI